MVSQTSVVRAPRTARAFSRAARKQLLMLDGLPASVTMKAITPLAVTLSYLALYSRLSSLMPSSPCQPWAEVSWDCGSKEVW